MRHTGLRTIGIAAVAAATLAFSGALSGAAWAQQKAPSAGKTAAPAASTKSSSGAVAGGNCIEVRNSKGNCIHSKSGANLSVKAAAPKAAK